MSIVIPVSTVEIEAHLAAIDLEGLPAVLRMYQELNARGYHYAGWAYGVATGKSTTGQAALDFMSETAMMDFCGNACKTLTPEQIDSIRIGMAQGYLTALARTHNSNDLVVDDVNYQSTYEFHKRVFEANGLTIDNWTLKVPMDIVLRKQGETAREQAWIAVRETGGDGADALLESSKLWLVVEQDSSEDAQIWLKHSPGFLSLDSLRKSAGSMFSAWNMTFADLVKNGISELEFKGHLDKIFAHMQLVGDNRFLDMMRGARAGENLLGQTNDENYEMQAKDFFNANNNNFNAINLKFLPIDIDQLIDQAKSDLSALSALKALSIVSVGLDPATPAKLKLADNALGDGITVQWINDRAALLVGAYHQWRDGNVQGAGLPDDHLILQDLDSGIKVIKLSNDLSKSAKSIIFGGSGNDIGPNITPILSNKSNSSY